MRTVFAACLLLASVTNAHAETCREKFIRLLTGATSHEEPVKIHVTQEIKGGPASVNYNYQASAGHWMSEMVTPAGGLWTLVYNDVMYTSADKGKTWKKLRALDSQKNNEGASKMLRNAADTVENASCATEDLNGVPHETVEADYAYVAHKTEHHDKHWINPQTGKITKSTRITRNANFESKTTQLIEPAPGLQLPTPE